MAAQRLIAFAFLGVLAQAQTSPVHDGAAGARGELALIVQGCVLAPGGGAGEGAVVVSSAGGRAVADLSGNFSLPLRVPRAAESVRVTAVGESGANLVAGRAASKVRSAVAVFDDGDGPALYVGAGSPDSGDHHLARWRCPLVSTRDKVRER